MDPLRQLASGFGLHLEGLRLLSRERSLWGLAAVPLAFSLLALGGAAALIAAYAGEIYAGVTGWLPLLEAGSWFHWLWVGPARLLFFLVGGLAFLAVAGAGLVLAFLLAGILAAPFLDALSRRVESVVFAARVEDDAGGLAALLREGARATREEIARTLFFVAVQGAILAAGVLIPGAQVLAPIAMALFSVLFLPLDYASYSLDRRKVPFREKRRWVRERPGLLAGYGSGAFLTLLVPGLNFLAMPLLVVTGTLLALRHPPRMLELAQGQGDAGATTAGASAAGPSTSP